MIEDKVIWVLIYMLLWICATKASTVVVWPNTLQMSCSYGERGSLTVYCVNATANYFRMASYRFDNLDETMKCINCTLGPLNSGTFDISGNQIKTLDIRNSSVQMIWPKAFTGLMFMERLLLSNNPIANIFAGAFIGIRKVLYLEIENAISTLEPLVFRELHLLQVLSLKKNKLTSLDNDTFAGLGYLRVLDLSSNQLKTVNNAFAPLTSLRVLRLQDNRLLKINGNEFSNLLALMELNLESNGIISFNLNLPPNNNLKVLNLARNRLTSDAIQPGTFNQLDHLEDLDLRKNLFVKIPPKFFQGLFRLRNLNLYANNIKNFSSGTFSGLPHLVSLNLSSNNLETAKITGRLLLNSLHTLDLSDNHIKEFDYIAFIASMPRIAQINMLNNDLPCQTANEIETLFIEDNIRFYMSSNSAYQNCDSPPKSAKEIIQKLVNDKLNNSPGSNTSDVVCIVLICIIVVLLAVLFYVQFFVLYRIPRGSFNIRIINTPSSSS